MKINNNPNIQKILGAYNKNIKGSNKLEKPKMQKDKIEISESAKEFQIALNAYKKLPEVRKEKVEEIKKQIASGNYNPSAEEIVNSMFDKKV
ncbi:flagellar biosynthesis anti-sigma factor FlgM [Crassaminicella thermophila]|uniref:Negative regulator of flagellin synthesis n=1 Tax=Crassaminicella thermophila TaxID=2599308 RepID=A0A5C0S9G5_CRATE|nr:flagellar biosynthesis anti-sigma factor FlgM [Crassaminicella thermophila]QEK11305.1 flagellar biosynthesis anti-sigma factor FlgM [Crassaminicella thermophila]